MDATGCSVRLWRVSLLVRCSEASQPHPPTAAAHTVTRAHNRERNLPSTKGSQSGGSVADVVFDLVAEGDSRSAFLG